MSFLSKEAFLDAPSPVPLATVLTLPACSTFELYERLVGNDAYPVLLESAGREIQGYSIIASTPSRVFRVTGARLECLDSSGGCTIIQRDPISALRDLIWRMALSRPSGFPPFFGGAIGYFGYDFVHWFERLPRRVPEDLGLPEVELAFFELVAVVDHSKERLWLIFTPFKERFLKEPRQALYEEGLARLSALQSRLLAPARHPALVPNSATAHIAAGQTQEEYAGRVRRCLDYIGAGDIYQANLSHRFELQLGRRTPRSIYRKLREINPSPFAALLEFPEVTLVGCSPERLVRLQGVDVDTRPIAGTRPRGVTGEEDVRLAEELILNEKERAEHLMLVDLERNDLGRVCAFGSVHVNDFMALERYSHVIHIVSNIRGRLASGRDGMDLIQAVFPGGTVTGVPKLRCMEILDELEPVRRGPYTGSVGYISANGDLDLNIIIRTLVIKEGRGYLHVGAGIVADSDPSREYQETLFKAEAVLDAVRHA
jgi:anthranilate/para-aminobenzoate synthase component I